MYRRELSCIFVTVLFGLFGGVCISQDVTVPFAGQWKQVVGNAEFSPRDTSEGVVFQGKMYLSNAYHSGNVLVRDLWNSTDGVCWAKVLEPTPYDGYSELVVYQDKMWAIKGSVWVSEDGVRWTQVLEKTPFGVRGYGEALVFDGKIWQLGSGADVWWTADGVNWICATREAAYGKRSAAAVAAYKDKLWVLGGWIDKPNDPPEKHYKTATSLNDVWCSPDGINWTCVVEHAAWSERLWFIGEAFAERLWVIGGFSNRESVNFAECWYTEDGRKWTRFAPKPHWSARHEPTVYLFQDALWVVAGNSWPLMNDVWKLAPAGESPAAVSRDDEETRFTKAADYSAQYAGRALLVQRAGRVIFERYDRGWTAERPHPLASGTKSFTGVMAMMAVQDGLLKLDEFACDTLPEWKSDPRKSKITARHLLTLSSGLPAGDRELSGGRSGGRLLGEIAAKRAQRLGISDDAPQPDNLNERALALPSEFEPGTRFQYGPSHFYAFSELLQRKLKTSDRLEKTTLEYLRTRLLAPVGIEVARIGRDRAGNPNLPGGMLLTAREWAKFGQFVLDGGSVRQPDGQRKSLLKHELLEQCFVPSPTNPLYGLTWWLRSSDPEADVGGALGRVRRQAAQNRAMRGPDGQPLEVRMAAGLGKQRLYVIPQEELVVVRFAEATAQGQAFDDRELLGRILGNVR